VRVGIVGPGRAGLGLALACRRAGVAVAGVHGRRRKAVPRGLRLSVGGLPPWLDEVDVVLLAVGDDGLPDLVRSLARVPWRRGQVVMHLSGALTHRVLAPLRRAGAAIASWHPLMTVSTDPRRASSHFRGAAFGVEGDASAVRAGARLARLLGGRPVRLPAAGKVRYHAGAVFASNYLVVMLEEAEVLLAAAGMSRRQARAALLPLALASLENVLDAGPAAALTGPVRRGDVATVRRHLAALRGPRRRLYAAVAQAATRLARTAGLPAGPVRQLQRTLREVRS
jgi:predicted short-subunit dehydrogenase-like oxidoreductase (DUF2520 family)